MFKSMSFMFMGLVVGLAYGKLATIYHWRLPPNWLSGMVGADGESSYDCAYISLYVDAAIAGIVVWAMLRLVHVPHQHH
jgi:hypothetical protein